MSKDKTHNSKSKKARLIPKSPRELMEVSAGGRRFVPKAITDNGLSVDQRH